MTGYLPRERIVSGSRPEMRLIFETGRTSFTEAAVNTVRTLLRQKIDWTWLRDVSIWHGTQPLLYRNLATLAPELVPEHVLQDLRKDFTSNKQRAEYYSQLLSQLQRQFQSEGIALIPYKGPMLATLAYGDVGLRRAWDLDLLVAEEEYSRATQVLLGAGYSMFNELPWEVDFTNRERTVHIDLHRRLIPYIYPLRLRFSDLWERSIVVGKGGSDVRSLSLEDTVIVLFIQAAKDSCEGTPKLIKIIDIAELILRHPNLDWSWISRECSALGIRCMGSYSLLLASELLGADLPSETKSLFRAERGPRTVANTVIEEVVSGQVPYFRSLVGNYYFHAKLRDKLGDRLFPLFTPRGLMYVFMRMAKFMVRLSRKAAADTTIRLTRTAKR
jgi:Uncharacterised nucleotidyltransferase